MSQPLRALWTSWTLTIFVALMATACRPKARLRGEEVPAGEHVNLKCSTIIPSPGWKFFWYRGKKNGDTLTAQDVAFLSNDRISTSQGNVYWCRGGRGNPVYYTEYSNPIGIGNIGKLELHFKTQFSQMMWFLNTFSHKQSCGDAAAQLARDILWGGAHAPVWHWRWGGLRVEVSMVCPQRPHQSSSVSRLQNQLRYWIAQWELHVFGEYEEWKSVDVMECCL